jgi:glycosyltransferase involved in cell wall biosynthesis
MEPLVTVGVPVYNGEKLLPRALDAVLAQEYGNLEILISDNASTDRSPEIIREYAGRREGIRIIRRERNFGASENFQLLVREARGKYFFWASADDSWDPHFVTRTVAALESAPEAGLALTAVTRIYDDFSPLDSLRFSGPLDPSRLSHWRAAMNCASGVSYHVGVYGLWRLELLRRVFRGYPLFFASDRLFMCGVALATGLAYVDEPLYVRTVHRATIADRYSEEGLGVAYANPLRYCKSALVAPFYLVRFPTLPLRRRLVTPLVAARFSVLMLRVMRLQVVIPMLRRYIPRSVWTALKRTLPWSRS